MSAIDVARELSAVMLPARQSLREHLALSESDDDAAFAIVTLHSRPAHPHPREFTAVVCLACFQSYVGVGPTHCDCGAPLADDADSQATNRVLDLPREPSFIAVLPTQDLAVIDAEAAVLGSVESGFFWPPWAIPPSIVGGKTMATSPYAITSPYVTPVKVAAPPPPPQVLISRYRAATAHNDTWLVIALCVVLIGFLYVLRTVLAL